jgi:hypothetical protein
MEKLFEEKMMQLFELLKKPGIQLGLLIAVMAVISGAGWAVYQTQIPPQQPIEFPHKVHVNLQIPCLYCHPGAWRQPSAGLPTVQKCWACHGQLKKYEDVAVDQWPAELQKLASYVVSHAPKPEPPTYKPIKWVPVYQVPDFVHFNHRPHVAAGLNCENCHGDMTKKTVATVEQTVNMGWCLNCHRARTENNSKNNPNNDPEITAQLAKKRTKLVDCGTCHY